MKKTNAFPLNEDIHIALGRSLGERAWVRLGARGTEIKHDTKKNVSTEQSVQLFTNADTPTHNRAHERSTTSFLERCSVGRGPLPPPPQHGNAPQNKTTHTQNVRAYDSHFTPKTTQTHQHERSTVATKDVQPPSRPTDNTNTNNARPFCINVMFAALLVFFAP